jgi:hypothetical protein
MESLSELRERRALECRLTPDRALGSLDEAEAFLQDRALLTRTPDCALPSLYEACHEPPYAPGTVGFGTWPATKWPWFGALTERGHLCVAVHRGKNLLVSAEATALLDPICRAETDRMRAEDPGWRRLLDHLARVGPSTTEDLRTELSLKRQELKALRSPLERCGVIVARSVAMTSGRDHGDGDAGGGGDGHRHDSELSLWDQAYHATPAAQAGISATAATSTMVATVDSPATSATSASSDPAEAFADLLVTAVRGAVVAPEPELRRWFSWSWYWTDTLVDDLVRCGRLRRLDAHIAVTGSALPALGCGAWPRPGAGGGAGCASDGMRPTHWARPGVRRPVIDTPSSLSPRTTGRTQMRVSVGTPGRGVPWAAHDDARDRKTPPPTEHNHDPRAQRFSGIRHWHLKTRTPHHEDTDWSRRQTRPAAPLGKLSPGMSSGGLTR